MSCKITPRQVGDVTILDCEGRITLGEGSVILRHTIQTYVYGKPVDRREFSHPKPQSVKILLNLGCVCKMDSSGIGELISSLIEVSRAGGSMKLTNLTPKIHEQLQITQLYSRFNVFDDEATAVASFSNEAVWGEKYYEDRH